MFSYWEQKHFSTYDTVIVGAGLSGLFTASNLRKKFQKQSVLILDKEMFPAASTKNAGFACMGSVSELEDDLKATPVEEVALLFEKRFRGLQIMRKELGDDSIGYSEEGSYELLHKKDEAVLDKISFWNSLLFSIGIQNAFSVDANSSNPFSGFSSIIKNELEGGVDMGKMYLNLKGKAQDLGIEILLNTQVQNFEKNKGAYTLEVENGFSFKANRLVFCTNAFTQKLLPNVQIEAARGQVILAKPNKDLLFRGIYHFDRGYYYFREIDGYVLFGGGRNLDAATEKTTEFGSNLLIINDLEMKLAEQILPHQDFEIVQSWSGIMGKSSTKNPRLEQVDENLFILAGFGGMGVALAPFMAQELVLTIN